MKRYSAILKPGYYQIGSKEYHAISGGKLKLTEDELLHFDQWSLLLWTDHPHLEFIGRTDSGSEDNASAIMGLLPKRLRDKSLEEVRQHYLQRYYNRKYLNIDSMAKSLHVDRKVLIEIGAESWFEGSPK